MRGANDDGLVLKDLASFGDVEELAAQVRAAGSHDRARDHHEGADPSDSIWVVVDGRGRVVGLDISRQWTQRLGPGNVAQALWLAYAVAVRNAMTAAAVAALTGPGRNARRQEPVAPASAADSDVDDRRWLAGVWATLEQGRGTLNRLAERTTAVTERSLTSPNGMFTLRLAGSGVIGISGAARLIGAADAASLRWEALAAFRAAGVTGGERPGT